MASKQLLRILLMLLASQLAYPNTLRHLASRPLHDNAVALSGGSGLASRDTTDPSQLSAHLNRSSAQQQPSPPPWELQLAPFLADLSPPRDPNSTFLRGPPRLTGVFKGSWLRTAYGSSLRPQDMLSSERGVIVVRLPAEQDRGPDRQQLQQQQPGDGPAGGLQGGGGTGDRPGGLQELRGEVVLRDGERVTDRDLRFRLRGTYVAAAGTVHAVLEPQLPLVIKAELDSSSNGGSGGGGSQRSWQGGEQQQQHQLLGGTASGARAGVAGVGGGVGGGVEGSGYREALRTAARNLVVLGPTWHRTLVRPGPPQPHHAVRRRAAADGAAQPSPPPLPRPPLELALLQSCELRLHFRVYYKGDPDAKSHVQFLRLDEPAPPPSPPPPPPAPPPAVVDATASGGVLTSVSTASTTMATTTTADAATVRHLQRRLAADTEIYHTTQMQLHADAAAAAAAAGDAADAAATAPDAVYGMPPGMDPLDPDLELIGILMSPNCDFTVHFNASTVHLERYYRQAMRYSILVATITIGQIVLAVGQSDAASTPSAAARMSLYCVTLQAILDAYQCLLHLTGALVVDALFAAFSALAFLQFLLFAVFEMRQTLLVWRAQRTGGGGGGDFWSVRRDMSAVYFRFYGLMLLGLLLMLRFRSQLALLVLALHSWWLPQLVHSAATDTRPPLKDSYVWGMSALRVVSPLYFYGCPSNVLRVQQHPGVCVALVAWVGLQAALLTAQMRLGPRVFIPRAFLPHRYDYHRPATKREMGIEEPATTPSAAAAVGGAADAAGPSSASSSATAACVPMSSNWWRRATMRVRTTAPLLRRLAAWLPRPAALLSAARSLSAALQRAAAGSRRSCGSDAGGGGGGDVDLETGHGSKECVICMNPVPLRPHSARMLTPCGHFFHEPCLTRWMGVKMDCPTCRRPLPPV